LSFHNGDFGSDDVGDSGEEGDASEIIGSGVITSSTISLAGFTLITLFAASLGTVTD
jgi:hypothetical protein